MTFCRAEFRRRGSYGESGGTWKRLLSRPSDSLLHFRVGFLIEPIGDFWTQAGSQFGERLVLSVVFDLVRWAHVIALGMVAEAVGLYDFKVGPLFLPNFFYDGIEIVVEFFRIGGIDFAALDAECLPSRERASRQLFLDRSTLGPAIVFDHEQDGRAPQRGQIECLIDQSFAQRAISHEDGCDSAGAQHLFG